MTDRPSLPDAPGTTPRETHDSRRPARRPLVAILRRAVQAPAAAAVLLDGSAPVRAFPGLDQPKVTIAAERGSYGFGIDDVVFTLRRAGPADAAISVRVSLAQADLYLPTDRLNATVRFPAGEREEELRIRAPQFNGPATESGALRATLVDASGYTVGRPNSARTRMVVTDPAITVRPEQAAYSVDGDDETVRVTFIARTEGDLPRPGRAFSLAVSAKAASDETAARRVARGVSQTVEFKPRNFVSTDGKWEASKTVSISTGETAEGLEVMFKRAASTPERVRPRNSDGTPCTDDVCMVPVFMAQSDEPTLTIAAGSSTYGMGIDDVVFTVTRNGTAEGDISVSVTLTQDQNFVSSVSRTSFTIPANEASRDVKIVRSFFDGDATQSGDLTATIEAGDGYTVGLPGSATVRMVVADPAVTVRPEIAAYRFVEGGAAATIAFVARTAPGVPRPGGTFPMLVYLDPTSGTATVGDDYEVLQTNVVFGPDDFTAKGGVWEARKEVSLTIVDDDAAEDDETVELWLLPDENFTPQRIRPRNADGSACADDVCTVPVTIRDDDGPAVTRIEIAPVPPAASADHGPYYTKDDFLALPDGAVHGRGARLTFTLTLDAEVTVTGAPELVLDVFDRERRARYAGGSGTRRLRFAWTVQKGDNDPDGLEFVSLDFRGGTIRDGEGHALAPHTVPAQRFAEHRVRGGLHAMRLEVSGAAREGEPYEIRVIRDGGFEEVAVAGVDVGDSAQPRIKPWFSYAVNGPGYRQFDFDHGTAGEPGVRVSTRSVTPPGDGVADASRTLKIRLAGTDAGFQSTPPLGDYRAWYLAEEPLEVTVPVIDAGLPLAEAGLRVHGASAREAAGATLAFRVTLSPHSEAPVTVQYRTGEDPHNTPRAVAGEDYVATEGMLTFEPGETGKTVEVDVLADDHDEGFETMRLFLENAEGARIDTASALGVIKNSGPIPKAWIARFGRTVADQVLHAVQGRMRAARRPGVEVTLAGRKVGGGPGAHSPMSGAVTPDDALSGTAFAATAEAARGGHLSLWGSGAVTRFDGREGELRLDGEIASAMAGADWMRERWTAGLIVSHSVAEGGYAGDAEGRVEATLTGLYPWGRLALSERVDAWGIAGYGTGEISLTPKRPGTADDAATVRTGLDLRMAAAGLRGVLVDGGSDGLALSGKGDALAVRTESDAARGAGGGLAAARGTVTRLRLSLEGERPIRLDAGATLTPSVEIGMRHDGGDAETGFGVELGGGIAWTLPKHGLRLEFGGRGLLSHETEGFRERGFSGALSWDPAPSSARGVKLTATQTVGNPASGSADALLQRTTLTGLGAHPDSPAGDLRNRRLEVKLGYGFATWNGCFASVPEIGFALSDRAREYSLGWRLAGEGSGGPGALALSAEARRSEPAGGNRAEHRVGARLSARW